jgi:hypothetical protein
MIQIERKSRTSMIQIEDIHDLDGAVLIQSVMRCGVSGV